MDWLIVNPISGSGRAMRYLDAVRVRCNEHAIVLDEKHVSTIPEIHDIAIKAVHAQVSRLWVLAGDGTVAALARHLCYSQTTVCPLPGGTKSVLCRELGIPSDPADAFSACLSGGTILMDVGQIHALDDPRDHPTHENNVTFLLMASAGIDAKIVRDVNLRLKSIFGTAAYLFEGLLKFLSFPVEQIVVRDEHGINRSGYHVIMQNTRYYGGSIAMTPNAKIDDGRLDVILIKTPSRWSVLRFLLSISSRQHLKLPYVDYFKTTTLDIQGPAKVSVQSDGDCMGSTPSRVTVLPKALRVLVPRSSTNVTF